MGLRKDISSQKPPLEPTLWQGLEPRASAYGVILCDIWGVVHNGVEAQAEAVLALELYRKECGGRVILITNAPRPCSAVRAQLARMGIGNTAYDGILTSGDLTQEALGSSRDGAGAAACYHLGPARDKGLFDGAKVRKVEKIAQADFILCTGLENDECETAADYRPLLEEARARGLRLLCANPDMVVERAGTLLPCAGALAALYETMGGEVIYFGKPHSPIYARAMEMVVALGFDRGEVLAIGDGILTDIKGAVGQGWDSLWVLGGIASHMGSGKDVSAFCAKQGVSPTAFIPHLRW